MISEAALAIDKEIFTASDIIEKVHETQPTVPDISIRTYVTAMAPDHPSSKFYPSTQRLHGIFEYLEGGKFKLKNQTTNHSTPIKTVANHSNGGLNKEEFLGKYKETIIQWTAKNKDALVFGRAHFGWNDKSLSEALTERNQISKVIVQSRIRNVGGIEIETIDKVMAWGGLRQINMDNAEALKITQEAFAFLDNGDLRNATLKLLAVDGIGIASASKIIGLFDQTNLAIYDSRVGTALRSLTFEGQRLVKCPAGRTRPGDACSERQWAEDYEKLIWILEVIRDWLNEQSYPFNVADVEIALFMMGK
jgi:hypothetical protein